MAAPVITTASSPVQVGRQIIVTGTNLGFVSAVALEDTTTHELIDVQDFVVDSGYSLHLTVPKLCPAGFYEVVLGTSQGEHSTNNAGAVNVVLNPLPLPPEPAFPEAGTTVEAIRDRMRYELGDYTEEFNATIDGDGESRQFELPAQSVSADGLAVVTQDYDGNYTTLTSADYELNARQGILTLDNALANGSKLYVRGTNAQFFTDDELDMFIETALLKHGHNATIRTVVRDPITGFKRYYTDPMALTNLPAVEGHLVAILATIEALWALAADASYDINVSTAEGTSLPRQERYAAIMQMIDAQQRRYDEFASKLGVGLSRIEMFTLRRVSRTTGRLVPVYQSREYDEVGPPVRVYPPVDRGTSGGGQTQREYIGQQYFGGP
jgi:hypothetical protein